MIINRTDLSACSLPTIQQFRDDSRYADKVFEYENHIYVLLSKDHSATVRIRCESGNELIAFNLRSRTVRGIFKTEVVKPLSAIVNVMPLSMDGIPR